MEKHIRNVEKVQKIAATLFISSITVLASLILYYSAFQTSPLVYKNLPFPVVNVIIRPGYVVPYRVDKCNRSKMSTNYTVTRYLYSLEGNPSIMLESSEIIIPPGCISIVDDNTFLPINIPPGKYKLVGVSDVKGVVNNSLRVEWRTEPFIVSAVK